MAVSLTSRDADYKLEDLSGIILKPGENPYSAFISACGNDHTEIRKLYDAHRTRRNAQQRARFLHPDFKELSTDQILLRLERPEIEPGFIDPRNCLTIWGRPPEHMVKLAVKLQDMLRQAAPGIWTMPPANMHITVLEVAHSKAAQEIDALIKQLRPSGASITGHSFHHRCRLVRPIISHDLSAFALSFLPADGEPSTSPLLHSLPSQDPVVDGDEYTYHHLRRDVYSKVQAAGIEVGSRYQVPSAHVTLGRFLDQDDHDTAEKRARWVKAIDKVNEWLEMEVWDKKDGEFVGEWVLGTERGLDFRAGRLWYGGGRTIMLGEGF